MSISQTSPRTATSPGRSPSAGWYWAAGLLAVAGLVAAVVWVLGAVTGLTDHVEGFSRTEVPGGVSVPIERSGTYFVYYEGTEDLTLDQLGVVVFDPTGTPVTVVPVDGGVLYDTTDRAVGHAVGEFQSAGAGTYRVSTTGDAPGATVAVGDRLTDDVVPPLIGAGLLLVLTSVGAIAIAVGTGVRRSRPTTTA